MLNIQHSLFSCLELNSLVAHLDSKITKNASVNRYGFQRKNRVESTPSISNHPQKAPLWAINNGSNPSDEVTAFSSSSLIESPPNTATETQSPTISPVLTPTRAVRGTPVQHSSTQSNWNQSHCSVSSFMPVQSQPSPLTSTPLLSKTNIAQRKETVVRPNSTSVLEDILDNITEDELTDSDFTE